MATRKPYLTLLLFLFVGIRLLSPQTHILSAIERVEIYTQTCSSLDPDCIQLSPTKITLEEDASHELNLMYHLLADIPKEFTLINTDTAFAVQIPTEPVIHPAIFSINIFHPPKSKT